MKFFTEEFNLLLTVIGATCCLVPLTFLGPNSKYVIRDLSEIGRNTDRHPILMGFLFVVIIPFADLLLNVPAHIASYISPVDTYSKSSIGTRNVARLTDFERFLFLMGMAIQSSVWFLPTSTDMRIVGAVSLCVWNCHQVLLLGPIIVYLQRCTTTFTERRAFLIVFSGVIGLSINSFVTVLEVDVNLKTVGKVTEGMGIFSGIVYFLLMILCLVKYFYYLLGTPAKRQSLLTWLESRTLNRRVAGVATQSTTYSDSDSELYKNYVPALHMLSSAVLAAVATFEQFSDRSKQSTRLTSVVISLLAQILVLVVELRIRKNEITRGLVR
jgi:hypothetical protein